MLKTHRLRVFSLLAIVTLAASTFASIHAATPNEIAQWTTEENSMPTTRAEQGTATYNGYIYQVGGAGTADGNSTIYAEIEDGGSVGAWQESPNDLPHGNFRLTAAAHNGYLYAIGGRDGGALNTIYRAALNAETGAPGAWVTEANTMPGPVYYHSSFVYGDHLYVVGGDDNSAVLDTVYIAPIVEGAIGEWEESENTLPEALSLGSVVVHNDYAYYIGGRDSVGSASDVVYYAALTPGNVGNWVATDDELPEGVYGASAVVIEDEVFLIGGHDGTARQGTVYSATIDEPGDTIAGWASAGPALPDVMEQGGAVVHDGETYVLGGLSAGSYKASVYSTVGPHVTSMETLPAENITEAGGTMRGEAHLGGGLTFNNSEDLLVGFHFNTEPTVDWENNTHSAPVEDVEMIDEDDTHISFSGVMDELECDAQYWYVAAYTLDGEAGIADNVETFTTGECPGEDDDAENVVSFISPKTGKGIDLELTGDCTFESVFSDEPNHEAKDPEFDYANGFVGFNADCGENGASTTVTVTYHEVNLPNAVVRKYNSNTNVYFTINDASVEIVDIDGEPATRVTYQVTDGGELDIDGVENGMISDPAGLTQAASSLASSGQTIALHVAGLSAVCIVGATAILIRRRRLSKTAAV
jgi:N-acetylneuraminic acid mutarotase